MAIYELEDVGSLPSREMSWAPPLEDRERVRVGDTVRLLVIVDGHHPEFPWVEVTAIQPPKPPHKRARLIGITRQAWGGFSDGQPIPEGTEFNFNVHNIIDL